MIMRKAPWTAEEEARRLAANGLPDEYYFLASGAEMEEMKSGMASSRTKCGYCSPP